MKKGLSRTDIRFKNAHNLILDWSIVCSSLGVMGFTETIIIVFLFGFTCLPENGIERVFLVISGASLFLGQWFPNLFHLKTFVLSTNTNLSDILNNEHPGHRKSAGIGGHEYLRTL